MADTITLHHPLKPCHSYNSATNAIVKINNKSFFAVIYI